MKRMHEGKRFLAILLALILVTGSLTATAYAAGVDPESGEENQIEEGRTRTELKKEEKAAQAAPLSLSSPSRSDLENAVPLTIGDTATAVIRSGGDSVYYQIVPEEDGEYVFYTETADDTLAYLYDAQGRQIEESDDDGAVNDMDFRLIVTLEAGQVYYLAVGYYSSARTGSIPVYTNRYVNLHLTVTGGGDVPVSILNREASVDLIVKVTADDETILNIHWYQNKDDGSGWVQMEQTGTTLTLAGLTEEADYVCAVTDPYGNGGTAYFSVYLDSGLRLYYEGDAEIVPNGSVTLTVTAVTDLDQLTYVWYFWDEDRVEYRLVASGSNTYQASAEGEYRCTVSDGYMTRSAYFWVEMNSGLSARSSTGSIFYVRQGDSVTMALSATTEYGSLSYAWYVYDPVTYEYVRTGGDSAALTVSAPDQNTKYYCTVSNTFESVRLYFDIIVTGGETAVSRLEAKTLEAYSRGLAVIAAYGDDMYFKITPSVGGTYTFYTATSFDTVATLYDADGHDLSENDDGDEDTNFKLTYDLSAGETYYLRVGFYGDEQIGSFYVYLTAGTKAGSGYANAGGTAVSDEAGTGGTSSGGTASAGTSGGSASAGTSNGTVKASSGSSSSAATGNGVSVGAIIKDGSGNSYKVTSSGKTNTVTFTKVSKKSVKSVTIPAAVKANGVSYKVTKIGNGALSGCKKLKKVTIGSNVTSIGSRAFYGDRKLGTVTVKTTKLTKSNVGSKAFAKIKTTCTFKVPSKKVSSYQKIFRAKGAGKKCRVKKA